MLRLAILLVIAVPLYGQSLEVQAGASTLFNATGGSLTFYTPGTISSVGLGFAGGHIVFGASTEFSNAHFPDWRITAGDKLMYLTAGLAGTGIALRGLSATKESDKQTITLFTGLTGRAYTVPYFSGTTAKNFGAGAAIRRKLRCHFTAGLIGAASGGLHTALEQMDYENRGFHLTENFGLIDNKQYSTAQGRYQSQHIAVQIARQTYLQAALHSVTDSEGLGASYGLVNGYTSAFQSQGIKGEAVGLGLNLKAVQTTAGETFSRSGRMFLGSVTENLSRRWSISQYVTVEHGNRSLDFGGAYRSNLISASVSYQQVFSPFGSQAFQKILMVGLKIQTSHGSVELDSAGSRWTAQGGSFIQTGFAVPDQQNHGSIGGGKFIIQGRVVDENGPVENAAVMVGNEEVFTNASGMFQARRKNNDSVSVRIVVEDFLNPGVWRVVDAPTTASPSTPVLIAVTK